MISSATALAAFKLNKPVKMVMSLQDNMKVIGKRFPCSADYEVGVNDEGVIQYLDLTFYSDFGRGGSENICKYVLEMITSIYMNDTWQVSSNSVRTDTPAGTWTRAPGKFTTLY